MLTAPPLHRRLACLVYEALILLGLALAAAAAFNLLSALTGLARHHLAERIALQAFEFLVLTGYGAGFWSAGRQTIAMKTWRLRLVTPSGLALTFSRATLRAVLAWVWVLPPLALSAVLHLSPGRAGLLLCAWVFLWAATCLLRIDRQYWHDVLAGTRLVDTATSRI